MPPSKESGEAAGKSKQALGSEVLHDFERAGDERNYPLARAAKTIELWVRPILS